MNRLARNFVIEQVHESTAPTFARIVLAFAERHGAPVFARDVLENGTDPDGLVDLARRAREVGFEPHGILDGALELLAQAVRDEQRGTDPSSLLNAARALAESDLLPPHSPGCRRVEGVRGANRFDPTRCMRCRIDYEAHT